MEKNAPRGIVVIDVGYTNTKAILFSSDLKILAERKIASTHSTGPDYKVIDSGSVLQFIKTTLPELDEILPVDCIVPCAHGACLATLREDGSLAFPIMDYASEPPVEIIAAYKKIEPPFSEVYCSMLPMALTHAVQLFWQQRLNPKAFSQIKTILPWMQFIAFRLSGRAALEISGMACQTQMIDVNTGKPSSLALSQGWHDKFVPWKKAWDVLGPLKPEFAKAPLRGRAEVLTGVHDSNANYLRYLSGGLQDFTLLSTGTWIISFNSAADISKLDHRKDTNTNTDVLGKPVACSRYFGGRELEVVSQTAPAELASLASVQKLIDQKTFALPCFTDAGGPYPDQGNKGRRVGPAPATAAEHASLAALYCAQMVSAQLDAVQSKNHIIVDGPFSNHPIFLAVLAQLREGQAVSASDLRDGTAAGAACLALMPDGKLPKIDLALLPIAPSGIVGLKSYHAHWQAEAARNIN
jgi:sugar (pentulose or hexulose) kinase